MTETDPFAGFDDFPDLDERSPADLAEVLRADGFLVAMIDTTGVVDESDALATISRAFRQQIAAFSGQPEEPACDWNVFMEDLESLQIGPAKVALVVAGFDYLRTRAPNSFRTFVGCVGHVAGDLKTRTAWGAPPENFPDDELVSVDLRMYFAGANV
jgi:hypothetical protein